MPARGLAPARLLSYRPFQRPPDHAMSSRPDDRPTEPEMNPADLWLEEVYTDRRVGTLRKMTPVLGDGQQIGRAHV